MKKMSNYKDVDKIINELTETQIPVYDKAFSIRDIIGVLEKAPTADVEEVRHGKWVRQDGKPEAICSQCGCDVVYQIIDNRWRFENYCPHCGAKMRSE